MHSRIALCWFSIALASCAAQPVGRDAASVLEQIVNSEHRSQENRARDRYRHPQETLEFFGLRPDMTVVEIWPGNGWYTEILAPLLRDEGRLYAAQMNPESSEYAKSVVQAYRAKLASRPDLYGNVVVTTLSAATDRYAVAPPESADLVLTFRNLHNWMTFGWERQALSAMHAALKPGGVLGVVEHRGNPDVPQDSKAVSGYVNESFAIELIESIGFRLAERSEINANLQDEKNYEKGVWALPPAYAAGEDDREKYERIGESDRFTLKFIKVAK